MNRDILQVINLNLMHQSESLREQSLQLLKEQQSRLKVQNKEMELRDDQIRFLKDTILALEQEKDAVLHQNHQLKQKLKTMAAEIANYNTNVVQKIYEENQQLTEDCKALREEIEMIEAEKSETNKRLKELEGKLNSESSERAQVATAYESLKETKGKSEKRIHMLEKENKELQIRTLAQQRQLDESASQITFCSQQIDMLTQKHHEALKNSEKKLKQLAQKMVPREQFDRIDQQAKDGVARNKQLRSEYEKLQRENERLKYQLATSRDKLLSLQIRQETKSQMLKIDLINLGQSIKIGKKVSQFESEQHLTASKIYDTYKESLTKTQKLEDNVSSLQSEVKVAQLEAQSLAQTNKLLEIQLTTLRQRYEEQQNCLEAEYQNKIMEISLRLKKEQIALSSLRMKENQYETLREEFEKQNEQHSIERDAMGRTMQQLRKENNKLSDQLNQAVKMCQQTLWTRECISHYKLTLQNMVSIIFYLYLLIVRNRQKTRKLYAPFLNYYFVVHPAITPSRSKKLLLRKFKAGVYMLIAIQRMRREGGKGRGLQWYSSCAMERRQKIENLSKHIQNISNTVLKGGKMEEILKLSQDVYRWKQPNYLRAYLPMGEDKQLLGESLGFSLDD